MIRKKLIAINAYIKKGSQINNLNFHLKEQGKEEYMKLKANERKETMKIKLEINKLELRKTAEKISETKRCFFEKIKIFTNF